MSLFLAAMAVLAVGGVLARAAQAAPRLSSGLAAATAAVGCAMGLVPALRVLAGASLAPVRLPWPVPYGSFHLAIDPLSAFFLVPLFVVSLLAAVYGVAYMNAGHARRPAGASWLFFHLLVASMAIVVTARNGLLFLVAWEGMSLASFFLVTFHDEREDICTAGWTYLVATHLGTAFLLALFVLLGRARGTMEFDSFLADERAGILFVLALVGFGTKAGVLPFHVWLPEAHPAAPSHVSALMSGVMIKTGIYGLVRVMTTIGPPPLWWGWTLVGVGVVSGVVGVVFALAQHDLKRLLAYHSVENIGIIVMGLGLGAIGTATGSPSLAAIGYAGGLLHVLNHALFKGLLFLGAGSVAHATGTREIDRLGGLLRPMPWTGTAFLVGAVAICGLPPLNGFASEFLVYVAAFQGVVSPGTDAALPSLAVLAGLAAIGGLAVACFTKAFGVVFLGSARSKEAEGARESAASMRLPMAALAAACVGIGLAGPFVADRLSLVIALPSGLAVGQARLHLSGGTGPLAWATAGGCVLALLVGALVLVRRRLLARRSVTETVTWGCGYLYPTPRMQYTASSFAGPTTAFFRLVLGTRARVETPEGLFPKTGRFESHTPDVVRERLYEPLFGAIEARLARLRWLQHGSVHVYVLYIALTLVALLLWRLR